jgi:predicted alpha/beta-hydrolase family hydrolase
MIAFARELAVRGVETATFNFPYAEQQRRIPDRGPVLESCFRRTIEAVREEAGRRRPLFIGGKSMGGRIATQVAAADPQMPLHGLVLLGYPLHPPGRPAHRRDAHLPLVKRPALFVQGSRDPFGAPEEMQAVVESMSPGAELHVVNGGDHSFKIPKAKDQSALYSEIQQAIVAWIDRIVAAPVPE